MHLGEFSDHETPRDLRSRVVRTKVKILTMTGSSAAHRTYAMGFSHQEYSMLDRPVLSIDLTRSISLVPATGKGRPLAARAFLLATRSGLSSSMAIFVIRLLSTDSLLDSARWLHSSPWVSPIYSASASRFRIILSRWTE